MHFCFLNWNRWSEPKEETWQTKTIFGGILIKDSERLYTKISQDRTCKKCGKYQKRYI
jgi:hypothetical protein